MSDGLNDSRLPNLRNAMRVMQGEVQRMQKVSRAHRKASLARGPRKYCAVCGMVFDYAIVDPKAHVQGDLCVDCKSMLRRGYTAILAKDHFAFIKSPHLESDGLAGKIVPVSAEVFDQIQKKYNVSKSKPTEPT